MVFSIERDEVMSHFVLRKAVGCDTIKKKHEVVQTMSKPRAYEGREPYAFVSYAHKDSHKVLPIIQALQEKGIRVWYDAGIEVGTEWPEYIAQHLQKSAVCMAFISRAALDSFNCRREINFAIAQSKELLAVYLEDIYDRMPLGMQMQLGSVQGVFYTRHKSMSAFVETLCTSNIMSPCGNSRRNDSVSNMDVKAAARKGMDLYERHNYREAIKYLLRPANQGDSDSQVILGLCYNQLNEHIEAARWLRRAADQGHGSAMSMLGAYYIVGKGVPEDTDEGVRLLQKAAALGEEEAIDILKSMGLDIASDSSANSDAELSFRAGEKFYRQKNYEKALPCLLDAAEQGHAEAIYLLAMCYLEGNGLEEDYESAFELMVGAARRGSASARAFMEHRNPLNDPPGFDKEDW